MKYLGRGLLALIVLAGIGMFVYPYLHSDHVDVQPSPSPVVESPSPEPSGEPSPSPSPSDHYPVPAESDQPAGLNKPVPPIDESDRSVQESLTELLGKARFDSLFNLKDIVRRIVVSIDNVAKRDIPSQEYSPFKPIERGFLVKGKGDALSISPANSERYKSFVDLALTVDLQKLVAVYVHFYPLFQSAYRDLGTQGYFNDRLVKVIDVILDTPEIDGPVKVTKTVHNIYKYSDEKTEALPAVQKILLRMGAENVVVIKTKFRELRELLVHLDHGLDQLKKKRK
jgi:hypothetical protein